MRQQIDYVRRQGPIAGAPRVLVIGASTGGLAARISAAFAGGAQTLGVFFERPSEPSKPGTPGWHNSAAFHQFAGRGPVRPQHQRRRLLRRDQAPGHRGHPRRPGPVDQVVYSLAAPLAAIPRRQGHTSVLKPVGRAVTLRGLDTDREVVRESTLEPATQDEIDATVAVMGGEDRCGSTRCRSRRAGRAPPPRPSPIWVSASPTTSTGTAPSARPEGPGPQGAGHPRQAGGARRRRPRVGAQGRGHAGQLGHPHDAAVPVAAVQGHEGRSTHEGCIDIYWNGPSARPRRTWTARCWTSAPAGGARRRRPACRCSRPWSRRPARPSP